MLSMSLALCHWRCRPVCGVPDDVTGRPSTLTPPGFYTEMHFSDKLFGEVRTFSVRVGAASPKIIENPWFRPLPVNTHPHPDMVALFVCSQSTVKSGASYRISIIIAIYSAAAAAARRGLG
ncbi:hypothetical protein DPEC_G00360430 [Dallia pectoralis]|uniref:Uncharacterized protein n=1 Tax=Dallia pectoralis TaxID=75939 RepID=A0ACC2F107_DALPE|nr:hypothetical protein DPEC_G00360430 [Dallia pectoralis]